MPKCTADQIEFGRLGRRVIEANFQGGAIGSDGGLLMLRQVERRLGLLEAVADTPRSAQPAAGQTQDGAVAAPACPPSLKASLISSL